MSKKPNYTRKSLAKKLMIIVILPRWFITEGDGAVLAIPPFDALHEKDIHFEHMYEDHFDIALTLEWIEKHPDYSEYGNVYRLTDRALWIMNNVLSTIMGID